jgi:hypothetical protein
MVTLALPVEGALVGAATCVATDSVGAAITSVAAGASGLDTSVAGVPHAPIMIEPINTRLRIRISRFILYSPFYRYYFRYLFTCFTNGA